MKASTGQLGWLFRWQNLAVPAGKFSSFFPWSVVINSCLNKPDCRINWTFDFLLAAVSCSCIRDMPRPKCKAKLLSIELVSTRVSHVMKQPACYNKCICLVHVCKNLFMTITTNTYNKYGFVSFKVLRMEGELGQKCNWNEFHAIGPLTLCLWIIHHSIGQCTSCHWIIRHSIGLYTLCHWIGLHFIGSYVIRSDKIIHVIGSGFISLQHVRLSE